MQEMRLVAYQNVGRFLQDSGSFKRPSHGFTADDPDPPDMNRCIRISQKCCSTLSHDTPLPSFTISETS